MENKYIKSNVDEFFGKIDLIQEKIYLVFHRL